MNCMRPFLLLCALVLVPVSTGAMVSAASPEVAMQKPAALPPDAPGPLYRQLPPPDAEQNRPSVEELNRLLREDLAAQPEGARQAEPIDEFKPISELPPEDRLPSAPMLVGAYAFVMLAIFAYLLSLSRRLNAVARDLAKFDSQSKRP